jgi:hypothetical protein
MVVSAALRSLSFERSLSFAESMDPGRSSANAL